MLDVDGKAKAVSQHNYHAMALAYCRYHARHKDDFGVTINPIDQPQSWGAWLAYFKTNRIPAALFKQRGYQCSGLNNPEQRAEHGFQVPTLMPSDFDADYDFLKDKMSGDNFMAAQQRLREQVEKFAWTASERSDQIKDALQRFHSTAGRENDAETY